MPNIIDFNTINENFLFYKICFSLSVYNSKNIIVDMILLSIKEWEKLFYFFLSWSKGLVPYVYFNLYADQLKTLSSLYTIFKILNNKNGLIYSIKKVII